MIHALVATRLRNQRLVGSTLKRPEDVVAWLGAVQAQEYGPARWGLGQRMTGATDAAIQQAFDDGRILRTHALRPTWHFVTPADIRWILTIGAPRVLQANAYWCRKNGLDARMLARGVKTIARALENRRHLTRQELADALRRARIPVAGQGLAYMVMHAELEGVICSGPRRGKQFTYALIDERAPKAKQMTADEALVELTRRYLTSHGPATVKDFTWWSGLTVAQAKKGIGELGSRLERLEVDGKTYWHAPQHVATAPGGPLVHLLPIYDELLIAFKDREWAASVMAAGAGVTLTPNTYVHQLVIDGRVEGGWNQTTAADDVVVAVTPYGPLSPRLRKAVRAAADRYSAFLERPVTVSIRA